MSVYPKTVKEVLDDKVVYRLATVGAVLRLKQTCPWKGTPVERRNKIRRLHRDLCKVYSSRTGLVFKEGSGSSGSSEYSPRFDIIVLRGRLSIITYLHEFAHALGRGERGACFWSINLFKKCFPQQFAALKTRGHMLEMKK